MNLGRHSSAHTRDQGVVSPGVPRPWHVGPELWPWEDGLEEGGRTPALPWHRGHPYPPPTPPPGSVVGQRLSDHPDVRKIAFTGSTEVGKRIMKR